MIISILTTNVTNLHIVIAIAVFLLAFILITTEKLQNTIAAMVGAFLLVVFHVLTQEEALYFIDFNTVGLLCGMMMTVAVMRRSGLFEYIAIKGIKLTAGNPWKILIVLSVVTAILSAFLDNVTTVLIIVPLTLAVSDTIKINPMPILISEILFSNIGGSATLIGDPPNIMIGGATHLGFMDFIKFNTPIVIIVAFVTLYLLKRIYYKELTSAIVDKEKINAFDEKRAIQNRKFLYTNLTVFSLVIIAFITHDIHKVSLASLALGSGFIMLLVTKQDTEEILKEVEWPTLFFFMGLFIIVGGLEKTGVIAFIADKMFEFTGGRLGITTQLILWVSAFASSFIDSIPFTATMISVIKSISASATGNLDQLWWALSLGACMGGNGTLIGAAANIIVAGFSQKTPYPIKFIEYFKVAFPLMLVSMVLASIYLYLRFQL